jgi:hypothetical protein
MNTIALVVLLVVSQNNSAVREGTHEFYDMMNRVPEKAPADPDLRDKRHVKEFEVACRIWTDKESKTYDGRFVDYRNGNVRIDLKSDRTVIEIAMVDLGREDQKWIRKELQRRADVRKKSIQQNKRKTR